MRFLSNSRTRLYKNTESPIRCPSIDAELILKTVSHVHTEKFDMLMPCRVERLRVERIAIGFGLATEYRGSKYIVDAAVLYAFAAMAMPNIYATIAAYRGKTASGVHKDAAYAVARSHMLSDKLSEVFDIELTRSDLHPNTVIAYIAKATKMRTMPIYDKEYG